MSKQLFIGYGMLEELAAVLAPDRPVYCALVRQASPSTTVPVVQYKLIVITAQPDDAGAVHYHRLHAGGYQTMDGWAGDEWDKGAPLVREGAHNAEKLIGDWLRARGFAVRVAEIAMPKTLKPLEGGAGFLQYDKLTRNWTMKASEVIA